MNKPMRTRHIQKIDKENNYKILENDVNEHAKEKFEKPAYYGVEDQLRKWGIDIKKGVDAGGQQNEDGK